MSTTPAVDPLLAASAPAAAPAAKPKAKRETKPAGPKSNKVVAPKETKAKADPLLGKSKKKPATDWTRPDDFAALKARVKAAVNKLPEPVETCVIAAKMERDARHVRWAAKELAAEKEIKMRPNKDNGRMMVSPA